MGRLDVERARQALALISEGFARLGEALAISDEHQLDVAAEPTSDFTVIQLAHRYNRKPSTVRMWVESGRFPNAYKLRGREWRVPTASIRQFEAVELNTHEGRVREAGASGQPARARKGQKPDLGDWRKVKK